MVRPLTIVTGHGTLRRHLKLLKKVSDSTCLICGSEEETEHHLVGYCKGYANICFHFLGSTAVIWWQDLLSFIKQSRRFEQGSGVVVMYRRRVNGVGDQGSNMVVVLTGLQLPQVLFIE